MSSEDGLGGRLYNWGCFLDGSVDSEKILREGDVVGGVCGRHDARVDIDSW